MIKSFSIFEVSSSLIYKDGDIVILDKDKICKYYQDKRICKFLDRISSIQRIYIIDSIKYLNTKFGDDDMAYYFKHKDLPKWGKFSINCGHIIRLANKEEVKGFEAEEYGSKFNL